MTMHFDYGHMEEGKLGKPYDIKLLKRLIVYLRPYILWIVISFFIVLGIIVCDLTLPYITKVALDNYIIVSARELVFTGSLNKTPEEMGIHTKYLIPSDTQNAFFLNSIDLKRLSRKKIANLETAGILTHTKYYKGKLEPEIIDIIDKYPFYFRQAGNNFFISLDNLENLKTDEVRTLRKNDFSGVLRLAILYIFLLIVSFIFSFIQILLMEFVGQNVMFDIRMTLFSHIQKLSLKFFDHNPIGRLVTRVTNDVQNLNEVYTTISITLLKDIVLLLGIIIVMFKINWELALISMLFIPIISILTTFFSLKARDSFRQIRLLMAKINASIQENISGMMIVQLFLREKENYKRFSKLNHDNYLANIRQILVFAIFFPLIDLAGKIATAFLIWYGGGKILSETLSLGVLVAFISYTRMFFQPIRDIAEKYNILQSAMASSERIFLLLDSKEYIKNPEVPVKPLKTQGKIEFKNVFFAYGGNEYVLKDVTFNVEPGETIAIVGFTGSGKSTLVNLLMRFYDIKKGEILLDGTDIKKMNKEYLRSRVSLVHQENFLFYGSIMDNISMGNEEITDKELMKITSRINADEFITRLPNKFNHEILDRGANLSAGEKQLLAFARALVHNGDIFILDEATANIDTHTELLIQDAIKKLTQQKTSLIIAHRLSTILHADRIIVLSKGVIKEIGSHNELIQKNGYYSRLYKLQYQEQLVY